LSNWCCSEYRWCGSCNSAGNW